MATIVVTKIESLMQSHALAHVQVTTKAMGRMTLELKIADQGSGTANEKQALLDLKAFCEETLESLDLRTGLA
jgi:hypothetical protein